MAKYLQSLGKMTCNFFNKGGETIFFDAVGRYLFHMTALYIYGRRSLWQIKFQEKRG
jgi:hypothetical protein